MICTCTPRLSRTIITTTVQLLLIDRCRLLRSQLLSRAAATPYATPLHSLTTSRSFSPSLEEALESLELSEPEPELLLEEEALMGAWEGAGGMGGAYSCPGYA